VFRWFEANGVTNKYYFKSSRRGTLTGEYELADWDNYALLSTYDISKFSAVAFAMLWLGGAYLGIFVATNDGWILGHKIPYLGLNHDTIITSPNQPCRSEIISTTGSGNYTSICSQVSVLGDVSRLGFNLPSLNTTAIACNTIGTIYALQGFKKTVANRDIGVKAIDIGGINAGTSDTGTFLLLRNPTLSAPLTYANYDVISRAIATNQTVTSIGEILAIAPAGSNGSSQAQIEDNYKSWLTQNIDNTFDEYVLAYLSASTNQDIRGYAILKTY